MLNSCASGVSVVNIDNGFGAGYQASLINKLGIRHGKNRATDTDAVDKSGNKDGTTDAKISLVKTS